jgi:hypothetical protein
MVLAYCVSCSDNDRPPAEEAVSTKTPMLELDAQRCFTDNVFTYQNMLVAVGCDVLYVWDWANLGGGAERTTFDESWVQLDLLNEPIKPTNCGYSLMFPGRIVCASHREDDTRIVIRGMEGSSELRHWSLGRRWNCQQLRNTRNGKWVAVHLVEDYKFVRADKDEFRGRRRPNSRNDEGRHQLGVISEEADEIRWVSTIYRHFHTLPDLSSMAVSEDGKYLAAVGASGDAPPVGTIGGGFIHVADVNKQARLWQKVPHGSEVPHGPWTVNFNDVCFSPDGKRVYVAGNLGLFCFDVATGRILSQWQIGGRFVGVDVSPDGSLVAGGTAISGYAYVYDAKTGKLLLRLDTDQGTLYRLTFSPDSTLLATSGTKRWNVKIWKMPAVPAETTKEETPTKGTE